MRQAFSGTAERIFMKLSPNDSGENGVSMGARPPNNFFLGGWGLKAEKSRSVHTVLSL